MTTEQVPYQAIVDGIADCVIYADREGTIRGWNEGATAVFGFAAEDALGKNLDLIVPEQFRERHWDGFGAAMERGATAGGREVRLTRGTHKEAGRRLYVEMSFAVVLDPDGAAVGAVAVARDVTERHLREREERRRQAGAGSG